MAANTIDPNTGVEIIRNRYHDNTVVIDGVRYTTADDPNKLTNNDFLELMLEEMKMQDPTKPMDSQQLMDSQLKMSTIESNMEMAEAMKSLQQSYAASALSTAANMIGHIVEDGSTNDDGLLKSYRVETVENQNGDLYVNVREIVGIIDGLMDADSEELVLYDADGVIYDGENPTEYKVVLSGDGRFTYNDDGSLKIMTTDNEEVTDAAILAKYAYAGSQPSYAEDTSLIPIGNIVEVR